MLFTSESVTEGHPDKLADQISDAVLDAYLREDKHSRVACEVLVKTRLLVIAGEVRSRARVDVVKVAKKVIEEVGYTSLELGFDLPNCQVVEAMEAQSPDISQGVDTTSSHEQGAGDQGMMFGYACNETPELMPAPIAMAHRLARRLAWIRRHDASFGLRPDGKVQVTYQYDEGVLKGIDTMVLSAQHAPHVGREALNDILKTHVVAPCLAETQQEAPKHLFINPTGRFVTGGPAGDAGLTGRKIIVDTYGGMGRHGGGAFSGKDSSKVDRSAAYYARYMAKNVVAAQLAQRCEVQLAYAIGRAKPVSLRIDTFGTGTHTDAHLAEGLCALFDARPASMVQELQLLEPCFSQTATYGHFGNPDSKRSWERCDRVDALKDYFGTGRARKSV